MNPVLDALEAAAEAGDGALGGSQFMGGHRTSSRRRVHDVRAAIRRFLEALPEDMTVMQVLEGLESGS